MPDSHPSPPAYPRLPLTALAALLLVYLIVQGRALGIFERDYDEGVYLAEAHLLYEGVPLYREIESASPPFFLWGLAAIFGLAGGPSVAAARLAIALSGALGLLAVAWLAARLAPPPHRSIAGVAAPLLLLLMPRWLFYGQMALADIPSLSLTLLSVALAVEGWGRGRRWYGAAGLVAGLALGTKLLAAYTAPLLALVVLLGYGPARPFGWRRFLGDGLATLGGFALPLLLALPLLDLPAMVETVIRFPWEAGREWVNPPAALRGIAHFFGERIGWWLLAIPGLLFLARQRAWRALALLLSWTGLVVLTLSQHAPLWGHLLLPLVPPLVLAGALALAEGAAALRGGDRARALPVLVATLLFGLLWPLTYGVDRVGIVAPGEQALLRDRIVPWLQRVTPPDEPILSDDPMLAVRAGRRLPPDATDTSFTKLASGFLSSDDLIAIAERERPAAVIFWSDRFRSKRSWQEWVEATYVVGYRHSDTRLIFLRPDLAREGVTPP